MSLSLKDDILNAIKKRTDNKTGCKTPKFREPTVLPQYEVPPMPPVKPPLPPTSGSNAVKPNPNYIPPTSVKETCTYETPCGWCSKWDKKCDRKIGCNNTSTSELDGVYSDKATKRTNTITIGGETYELLRRF